jgi:hypothetical protein
MLDETYYKLKLLVRPIVQHRRLLERAKYSRTRILSPQEGNDLISHRIHQPAAIGKIGSSELAVLRYYLRRADPRGQCQFPAWQVRNLYRIAGVYPPEPTVVSQFCEAFAEALTHLDVLAVWFNFGENAARLRFAARATLTDFYALEPYCHNEPWSQQLAGKRVLVVSPFTDTINAQYQRRQEVWRLEPQVLPDFQLLTLRCPLSAFLTAPTYPDWFAALDAMRDQMASMRFDVAVVGAGAWSLPLVAHAKSLGACAIHLGGATQILFGIRGGRWDKIRHPSRFYNEAWTRPAANETPPASKKIEGGCYW